MSGLPAAAPRGTPSGGSSSLGGDRPRSGEDGALLRVEHLEGGYGDIQVLWDVSLEVGPREIVTVIGANGAGKTTTLRTVIGILPPHGGGAVFRGRRLDRVPPHEIVAAGLTLVPEGRHLFPFMTVQENLLVGSHPTRARAHRRETLDLIFSLFPILAERRGQLAGTLSGGQQQMVAVARGLAARPRLLMLDEPSLGLAPIVVREIFAALGRIRAEGVAILLVEQNVRQSLRLADRAYVLENGRTVAHGSAAEMLGSPELGRKYLGLE